MHSVTGNADEQEALTPDSAFAEGGEEEEHGTGRRAPKPLASEVAPWRHGEWRLGRQEVILEAIRSGMRRGAAIALARISAGTFYAWLRDPLEVDPAGVLFAERVLEAEAQAEQESMRCIMSTIRAGGRDGWQAAAWWLERSRRADYGRAERNAVVQVALKEVRALSDEELKRLAYGTGEYGEPSADADTWEAELVSGAGGDSEEAGAPGARAPGVLPAGGGEGAG